MWPVRYCFSVFGLKNMPHHQNTADVATKIELYSLDKIISARIGCHTAPGGVFFSDRGAYQQQNIAPLFRIMAQHPLAQVAVGLLHELTGPSSPDCAPPNGPSEGGGPSCENHLKRRKAEVTVSLCCEQCSLKPISEDLEGWRKF